MPLSGGVLDVYAAHTIVFFSAPIGALFSKKLHQYLEKGKKCTKKSARVFGACEGRGFGEKLARRADFGKMASF